MPPAHMSAPTWGTTGNDGTRRYCSGWLAAPREGTAHIWSAREGVLDVADEGLELRRGHVIWSDSPM